MPFRASFDCLWCGRSHTVRSSTDLEGWAQLCPECLGRAGDNGFLRERLRAALAERARGDEPKASDEPKAGGDAGAGDEPKAGDVTGARNADSGVPASAADRDPHPASNLDDEMRHYYAARAGEYDDWYLRRGRYSHGPLHDVAWQADLEAAAEWLQSQPLRGEIVELAAGTGWWSPILAARGELSLYDAVPEPLERARQRLVAHGLRAHLHLRDAWEEPDRQVDVLFAGFWISHVPRDRLGSFLSIARRWLRPGGSFLFIDSRRDPQSGAVDQPSSPNEGLSRRRLADGREFTIPKVHHGPDELRGALLDAGFATAVVSSTSRFFLLGRADA